MKGLEEYLDVAYKFHGHKCPAMPMGLRAGLAAMRVLAVERSQDKELIVEAETGKCHANEAKLEGMSAAGCMDVAGGRKQNANHGRGCDWIFEKGVHREAATAGDGAGVAWEL